jgi:hypothetical protein
MFAASLEMKNETPEPLKPNDRSRKEWLGRGSSPQLKSSAPQRRKERKKKKVIYRGSM